MAELVHLVGGLVGLAHGEKRQGARAGVEDVVRALRNQRQRSRQQPGGEFGQRKTGAGQDRGQRSPLLAAGICVAGGGILGYVEGQVSRQPAESNPWNSFIP
jgi:hypothetical protein